MRAFDYTRAATVPDAVGLLAQAGGVADRVRPLAGGTDLLPLMKLDLVRPEQLVDIKRLGELDTAIAETGGGVRLGALTTLATIEASELLETRHAALTQAAAAAATPQLRHMATIGGNILQRPRCWYFRHPDIDCWLKGGESCPARAGENQLHALYSDSPCVAVHPADPATALVALEAQITARGPAGERTVPLEALLARPTADRRTETTLAPDELITAITLPAATGQRSVYRKAMDRHVWAFAVVSVAVAVTFADGRVSAARVVLGGVDQIPHVAAEAGTALLGSTLDDAAIAAAVTAATTGATPLTKNAYKVPLTQGLVREALTALRPEGATS